MRKPTISGNIFVANLPEGFKDEQLGQLFDSYGLVVVAHVARDFLTGQLKNFGLVDLAPAKAAAKAIQETDGKNIDGRTIKVRAADPSMSITLPTRHRAPSPRTHFAPTPQVERRPVVVEYRSRPRRIGLG